MNLWGVATAVLFFIAYLPQLWKTWRTKSTRDLSVGSFLLPWVGGLCGVVYSWQIHNSILLLGYSSGLVCTSVLIVFCFLYRA